MDGLRPPSLLADSLRAHALRFERPLRPLHDAAAGLRMLLAFVAIGFGLFLLLRHGVAGFIAFSRLTGLL